jgi:hypothetical protein
LSPGFDLFEFYRFMLAVMVGIYSASRLTLIIWRWELISEGWLSSSLLRRYVIVLLLRMRLRQFTFEFGTIAGLLLVLALLIRAHWA